MNAVLISIDNNDFMLNLRFFLLNMAPKSSMFTTDHTNFMNSKGIDLPSLQSVP